MGLLCKKHSLHCEQFLFLLQPIILLEETWKEMGRNAKKWDMMLNAQWALPEKLHLEKWSAKLKFYGFQKVFFKFPKWRESAFLYRFLYSLVGWGRQESIPDPDHKNSADAGEVQDRAHRVCLLWTQARYSTGLLSSDPIIGLASTA